MSAQDLISTKFHHIPVRSPRGNEMIRRDPRELPRRLRGLLLAINGQQTVGAYIHTLAGFGDVAALLDELIQLGLVELRSRGTASIRPERPMPSARTGASDSAFMDPSALGGHSQYDSSFASSSFIDISHVSDESPGLENMFKDAKQMSEVLYDPTIRGSFDDLVREARSRNPGFVPAPPAPPLTPEVKNRQIESLFNLLEDVRRERRALKRRVEQLRKYRDRSRLLAQENKRLSQGMMALVITCGMLVAMVFMLIYKR